MFAQILKHKYPSIYQEIKQMKQTSCGEADLHKIADLKRCFDAKKEDDKYLFAAVVFKKYHPDLFEDDCFFVKLKRGVVKTTASVLGMKESNVCVLFKTVRTRLKYNAGGLKDKVNNCYVQEN